MPGGGEGLGMGVGRGVSGGRQTSEGFQEGRVSRGCPGHPPGKNEK